MHQWLLIFFLMSFVSHWAITGYLAARRKSNDLSINLMQLIIRVEIMLSFCYASLCQIFSRKNNANKDYRLLKNHLKTMPCNRNAVKNQTCKNSIQFRCWHIAQQQTLDIQNIILSMSFNMRCTAANPRFLKFYWHKCTFLNWFNWFL